MLLALALAAALQSADCAAVPGADRLWASPQTRYVFVGEFHGTREEPALFGDLVCLAARSGRPVVVAVEQDTSAQPAIDAYLASDGGPAARQAFVTQRMWRGPLRDGRASEAYLQLFEQLRALKRTRAVLAVVAFRAPLISPERDYYLTHPAEINVQLNRGMADQLAMAARTVPRALVLVYTGSVHANREPPTSAGAFYRSSAALLPASETVSVRMSNEGGTAWNCHGERCEPFPVDPSPHHPREVVLAPGLEAGFDGLVYVGGPVTASPPAPGPKPTTHGR